MYCKLLTALCLFGLILTGCSKSLSYEEQISKILEYEEGQYEYTDEQFENLLQLIEENPETLDYDFSEFGNVKVITSDDKKVKAYCLDIDYHDYGDECRVILQNNVCGDVNTILLPDTITAIENIYSLSNNRYLFIGACGSIHQGIYSYKRADVYEIGKQNVSKLPDVFSIGDNKADEIEVLFVRELSSRDDEIYVLLAYRNDNIIEDDSEIDKLAILYNQPNKELYVADIDIAPEGSQAMTGTFRHYQWDGNIFRDITMSEPLEFCNDDYYIRIEQEKDGSCTYMCWNGGKKSGKPNLVIRDGIRQFVNGLDRCPYNEWISEDESAPDAEEFIFHNNGYTYRYITGCLGEELLEDLSVYNAEDDVVYSGSFEPVD